MVCLTSSAINPDTGERYLTAASRRGGGLYLIDAAGERANMTGLRDNGSSYEARKWVAGAGTDRSCDWSINRNNRVGMNKYFYKSIISWCVVLKMSLSANQH